MKRALAWFVGLLVAVAACSGREVPPAGQNPAGSAGSAGASGSAGAGGSVGGSAGAGGSVGGSAGAGGTSSLPDASIDDATRTDADAAVPDAGIDDARNTDARDAWGTCGCKPLDVPQNAYAGYAWWGVHYESQLRPGCLCFTGCESYDRFCGSYTGPGSVERVYDDCHIKVIQSSGMLTPPGTRVYDTVTGVLIGMRQLDDIQSLPCESHVNVAGTWRAPAWCTLSAVRNTCAVPGGQEYFRADKPGQDPTCSDAGATTYDAGFSYEPRAARLADGGSPLCPACSVWSPEFVKTCAQEGLVCDYFGGSVQARCTCKRAADIPGYPDAGAGDLVFDCYQ